MIPNTLGQIPPSPLKKHVHCLLPVFKIHTLEDFLTLKSRGEIFQFPSPHKVESPSNSDTATTDSGSPKEPVKDESSCTITFQQVDKENFMREKQEILIPMRKEMSGTGTGLLLEGEKIYKQRRIQSHYIRYDYLNPEPKTEFYDATDKDLDFLNNLNKEISNGCSMTDDKLDISLTRFEKIIEIWEHETAEGSLIPLQHAINVLNEPDKQNISDQSLEKIYEHWKCSRELFRRPLLRRYWKAAHQEEFNPNCAFKKRKENKFARRRSHRMSSPQSDLKRMKTLKKNMDKCLVLLADTKYREMLKLEIQDLKRREFDEQLKELGEEVTTVNAVSQNLETYYEETHYEEAKKSMVEYNKQGEVMLKSINRLKTLKNPGKSLKRKLVATQPSTTSSSLYASTIQSDLINPMPQPISQKKFSSLLPKQVRGSFTLPIRKSSIEVNDLKEKLKLSLGGLYLRTQDDLRVKVELNETKDKGVEKDHLHIGTDHNPAFDKSQECLTIKIDLEEHPEKTEAGRILGNTTVKYNIIFHKAAEKQRRPSETIRKKVRKSGSTLQLETKTSTGFPG